MLKKFPGEEKVFMSADSVRNNEENGEGGGGLMYPVENLNTINCSGLPLAKLKVGCPVMILRNLNPAEGVCNGSQGIVTRMSNRVLEVRLLTGEHAGKSTFIPRLSITPSSSYLLTSADDSFL